METRFITKTNQGLVCEQYCNSNSKAQVALLSGMNVLPPHNNAASSYFGNFAEKVAMKGYDVHIVYQPGVSPLHKSGYYDADTTRMQLEDALELGAQYLITHSLSTVGAYSLMEPGNDIFDRFKDQIKGITLASAVTTQEEALNGRSLCGVPLITLCRFFRNVNLPFWYPLTHPFWHEGGFNDRSSGAKYLFNLSSSSYALKIDGYVARNHNNIPLLSIIAEEDRVFPAKGQQKIAENLGAEIVSVIKGHNVFVGNIERLVDTIVNHIERTTNQKPT